MTNVNGKERYSPEKVTRNFVENQNVELNINYNRIPTYICIFIIFWSSIKFLRIVGKALGNISLNLK